ncbi:hypothetical protein CHELA20_40036 [Hyphomicrobiales bacterium]|nr:hypothetical protein CHELA20_40036 [Hyphomicrobiales bacterium]CAH1687544.1 hypothetical protein CHELA41_40036 [Hyphomicrobiales bacterium]
MGEAATLESLHVRSLKMCALPRELAGTSEVDPHAKIDPSNAWFNLPRLVHQTDRGGAKRIPEADW